MSDRTITVELVKLPRSGERTLHLHGVGEEGYVSILLPKGTDTVHLEVKAGVGTKMILLQSEDFHTHTEVGHG